MKLAVKPNPLKGKNALLCFKQEGLMQFDHARVHFSYIPDREIVEQDVFKKFSQKIAESNPSLEDFSNQLVETFYHAALPFYAKLDIQIHHKETGEVQRLQTVEKQPKYKIPEEVQDLLKL